MSRSPGLWRLLRLFVGGLALLVLFVFAAHLPGSRAAPRPGAAEGPLSAYDWQFEGHVYEGAPWYTGAPKSGVTVGLYGSNLDCWDLNSTLTHYWSTTTDASGHFSLNAGLIYYPYWNVIVDPPAGYHATGSETASGKRCSAIRLQHAAGTGGAFTGDDFWVQLPPTVTGTPTSTGTPTRTPTRTSTPSPTRTSSPVSTRTPTRTRAPYVMQMQVLPLVMKQRLARGAVIFSDDFEDGDLAGWTPNRGSWDNPGSFLRGGLGTGAAWNMRSESGGNLIYQGSISLLAECVAGLTFRASADGNSSYDVRLNARNDTFQITRRAPHTVLASAPVNLVTGRFYRLLVVVKGNRIDAYLDGVKRLTVTDSTYTTGKLGVVADGGWAVYDFLEAWRIP